MAILYTWDYYLYKCHPHLMLIYPISSFIYLEVQNDFHIMQKNHMNKWEYFILICTNKLMFGKGHKCLFWRQVCKFSDYFETWTSEASHYPWNHPTDKWSLSLFWCNRNEGTPRLCLWGVAGTLLSSCSLEDTEPRKSCQVHRGPTTKIKFSVNKVWRRTAKVSADRDGSKPGRSLGNTPSSSAERSVMSGGCREGQSGLYEDQEEISTSTTQSGPEWLIPKAF